ERLWPGAERGAGPGVRAGLWLAERLSQAVPGADGLWLWLAGLRRRQPGVGVSFANARLARAELGGWALPHPVTIPELRHHGHFAHLDAAVGVGSRCGEKIIIRAPNNQEARFRSGANLVNGHLHLKLQQLHTCPREACRCRGVQV